MRKTQTMPPKRERPKLVKMADKMLELFGPDARLRIEVSYPAEDNSFYLYRDNPSR